jgi:hypothetical protein
MEYWGERWDWECPTLFGLEHDEFVRIVARWPRVDTGSEQAASFAAVGAMRELLFGASAPAADRLPDLIGLSHAQAVGLAGIVHSIADGLAGGALSG